MNDINAPFEEHEESAPTDIASLLQEFIAQMKPWSEFFNVKAFDVVSTSPTSPTHDSGRVEVFRSSWRKNALNRVKTNLSFYMMNYAVLPLVLCILTLLYPCCPICDVANIYVDLITG